MNYDDIECPRCKTTKYRNPQLKLLVNSCGHPLCENCIELMFATGTAKCYQCPVPLKRGNFKRQLFQDSQVEKDVQVRRDILRKFNKNQDAFPNLRAYNDYLEKLETVIYNLANNIDIDDTNRLLDELRRPTVSIKEAKVQEAKHKIRELPYYHKVERFNNEGPTLPQIDERYVRATGQLEPKHLAGGFSARLAVERALSDAFSCLWRANLVS